MKGKRPPWLVNAIRYEKRFIAFAWSEITKGKAFYVKSLSLFVVVAGTISGLLSSSEDTEVYRSGYGIKAATCALGAAGIVFIGMIPTASSAKPSFDPFIRALAGAFAFLAGMFWLLAETGGNMQPYLLVVLSTGGTMLVLSVAMFLLGAVNRWEGTYQRRRKEGKRSEL